MGIDILQTYTSADILLANEKWVKKNFPLKSQNLTTSFAPFGAQTKHEPHTFFLGCSDARYNESCLGYNQGEVFTVKTIANIFKEDDISTAAALEYAIDCVGIKQLIVCGHTDCGGVNTCLLKRRDLLPKAKLSKLYHHLEDIDQIIENNWDYITETVKDENNLLLRGKIISELNVVAQIDKLLKLDVVKNAIELKGLKIIGLIYDVDTHLVEKVEFL